MARFAILLEAKKRNIITFDFLVQGIDYFNCINTASKLKHKPLRESLPIYSPLFEIKEKLWARREDSLPIIETIFLNASRIISSNQKSDSIVFASWLKDGFCLDPQTGNSRIQLQLCKSL